MALVSFRSYLAVILLATGLLFCGQAKALPVAEEIPLNFKYSAEWEARIQGALKKPLAAVIVDDFLPKADQDFSYEQVWDKIHRVYGKRISELDQQLPGFGTWLVQGLTVNWGLIDDEKSLDPNICHNFSLHQQKQKVVACQSMQSVRFLKSWFKNKKKDADIAEVFVHELVRYHMIRLGKTFSLHPDIVDEITADVTYKILSTDSAADLYILLVEYNLLLRSSDVELLHLKMKLALITNMKTIEEDIRAELKACSPGPHEKLTEDFNRLYSKMNELEIIYSLREKHLGSNFKKIDLQQVIQKFVNCISGVPQ